MQQSSVDIRADRNKITKLPDNRCNLYNTFNGYRPDRNNITGYPLHFIQQNPVDIGQAGAGLPSYRITGAICTPHSMDIG